MPETRVLLVKLSSLGDVIHNLPAVSDLRRHRPAARIEWAVEEAYADLVALHPAIERAIPVNLRRLRGNLASPSAWRAFLHSRRSLSRHAYDAIVDTQGLVKSAVVAGFADGPVAGYDSASARESLAARLYDRTFAVPRDRHAVERNRALVGLAFGYAPEGAPDFGLRAPGEALAWLAPTQSPVVTFLHGTSRADKLWPEDAWIALGRSLAAEGMTVVLPGGSDAEHARSARMAAAIGNAVAAPPLRLVEAAALLARSRAVVGVDTGLAHLAVALGRPTVGIYCATDPALTGLAGGPGAVNLGGQGTPPGVAEVAANLARIAD
jgi:heptosyltransferase-1